MRKNIIKRVFVTVVGVGLFVYIIFLLLQGQTIVSGEYQNYNYLFYFLILGAIAFFTIAHGIFPFQIKWHKITLLLLGVFLILISQPTYLIDNSSQHIYVGDMVSLFGVCVILFGATGFLHSKKSKKRKSKDVEIIEV